MEIDIEDMHVGTSSDGPFRDYLLNSRGSTIDELIQNAFIQVIDQDGGECGLHTIESMSGSIYERSMKLLIDQYNWSVMGGGVI